MDSEEYSQVVSSGLLKEVLVMTVLLIDVMTSVLIIVIVRVPINLLSRPPLVVITTVARVTILPRTTIILYILKLTAHILKPRVYVEPVLNLTVQWDTSLAVLLVSDDPRTSWSFHGSSQWHFRGFEHSSLVVYRREKPQDFL